MLTDVVVRGAVEAVADDGVAGGVFVDVGSAVTNPLPRDEDGHDVVELKLHHFEGGRVTVAGEVADQAAVFIYLLGAGAVRNSGGLHDGEIGGLALGHEAGHDIDEGD